MQNKYVCDPGDFAKCLLLETLCDKDLALGINWYLTPDEKNNDGLKLKYLDDGIASNSLDYQMAAPELYRKFQIAYNQFTNNNDLRNVSLLEGMNVFPINTKYYGDELKNPKFSQQDRSVWFGKSKTQLEGSQIIFCDPDNGMPTKKENSIKHIKFNEIAEYYEGNSTVIVYHHAYRMEKQEQKQAIEKGLNNFFLDRFNILPSIQTFYCSKGTGRFFFVIMQDHNSKILLTRISKLLTMQKLIIKIS